MCEWRIIGGAQQLLGLNHRYASGKQGAEHRLTGMTAGNAIADYPLSTLANRNQVRKESWKTGSALKQRNAPEALGHLSEERHP